MQGVKFLFEIILNFLSTILNRKDLSMEISQGESTYFTFTLGTEQFLPYETSPSKFFGQKLAQKFGLFPKSTLNSVPSKGENLHNSTN